MCPGFISTCVTQQFPHMDFIVNIKAKFHCKHKSQVFQHFKCNLHNLIFIFIYIIFMYFKISLHLWRFMSADSTLPSVQIKINFLNLLKFYWYKGETQYLLRVPSCEGKLKNQNTNTMFLQTLGRNFCWWGMIWLLRPKNEGFIPIKNNGSMTTYLDHQLIMKSTQSEA